MLTRHLEILVTTLGTATKKLLQRRIDLKQQYTRDIAPLTAYCCNYSYTQAYFNAIVDMSFFHFSHCFSVVRDDIPLGSLSNDDGDGNENGKTAIGLDKQNNNFVRASRFLVHFFTVAARLQHESA